MSNLSRNCYTYVVTFTHPETGQTKKYYGSRTRQGCDPSELGVKYFTSSRHVHDLLRKYGRSCFAWHVDDVFGMDALSCVDYESQMIKWLNAVHSDEWINRHDGQGAFNTTGMSRKGEGVGRKRTDEQRAAISRSLTGKKNGPRSQDAKSKISASLKGIKRSDETRELMSKVRLDKKRGKYRPRSQSSVRSMSGA